MKNLITVPNMVTIVGIFIAIGAIIYREHLMIAMVLIIANIFIDYFDGKLAQWLSQESKLGCILDSLNDFLGFLLAPMVLVFANYPIELLFYIIAIVYCIAGTYRLIREHRLAKSDHFTGLPTTASAFTLLSGLILLNILPITLETQYRVLLILIFLLSAFMISKIPVKRLP